MKKYSRRFIKVMRSTLRNAGYDVDNLTVVDLTKLYSEFKSNSLKRYYATHDVVRKLHSEETKRKIAAGNTDKVFTRERCRAISKARTLKPTVEQLSLLNNLWALKYVNPSIIMELAGVKTYAVYQRFKDEYCNVEQTKFMPGDMYPSELKKLIELADQGIHYKEVAAQLDRGEKQVYNLIKKVGLKPVTKGFRSSEWSSQLERDVGEQLRLSGLELTEQFYLNPFYFDFHVVGTNHLIEVHGDYWHCNPNIYVDGPVNEWQRYALRRDFAKKAKAEKMGYRRHVVWEHDFREASDSVVERLRKRMKR